MLFLTNNHTSDSFFKKIILSYNRRLEEIASTQNPFKKRDLAISFYTSFANFVIEIYAKPQFKKNWLNHPLYIKFRRMYEDLEAISREEI